MISYKNLVSKVLKEGAFSNNRTGIPTISLHGMYLKHDMSLGLPILTTKEINIKACIHELLWFLRGDTNIKYLNDNGVHIWDAWADKNGNLGPIYGKQWRSSGPNNVDQVAYVINEICTNPQSRRIVIDAWSPSELNDMALPPCHILYQFLVSESTNNIDLCVYMRSADLFLGVPFDIAEGGLLLSLIAKITGYTPNRLIYFFGDAHIYLNHISQIETQLKRTCFKLPKLELPKKQNINDYVFEDFNIIGYEHHSKLKGKVAV